MIQGRPIAAALFSCEDRRPAIKLSDIPFGTTDWSTVPSERHSGEVGEAIGRTQSFGPAENRVRARMVEYTPGHVADHWCSKGHIILCLEGAMETTLEDGRVMPLKAGMTYQVADGAEAHRSSTAMGAKLLIVDRLSVQGDWLDVKMGEVLFR